MVSGRSDRDITPVVVTSRSAPGGQMERKEAAELVVETIKAGGLAVVPLDVSYACLAGTLEPLKKIYELKLRPVSKPCPVLASWEHFVDVAGDGAQQIECARRVVDAGLPVGFLTHPLPGNSVLKTVPSDCMQYIMKADKVAMFINMGGLSRYLIDAADRDGTRLFGSSANISGKGNSFSLDDVPGAFFDAVDIVVDAGDCKYQNAERLASSIVDLSTGEMTRAGILEAEIMAAFHSANS
jgi:tRNA A37 threonylcarbamoyladenosine synthetase subunit TsaC/SUA5/YrdC